METNKDKILLWEKTLIGMRSQETSPEETRSLNLRARLLSACVRYNGIGVAAPQIGVNLRAALICSDETLIFMLNPKIVETSGESVMREGCLSLPAASLTKRQISNQGRVKRPMNVTVKYLSDAGEDKTEQYSGLMAHAVQHEVDHLDGVFFIDHVGIIERSLILRRFGNFKRAFGKEIEING